MISVSMDPPDEKGDCRSDVRIKGNPVCVAMMLTVLVKNIAELQPITLDLHADMLTDPDFIMEVKND